MSTGRIWIIRIGVLLALALTLTLAGPRALAVLRTRLAAPRDTGPTVPLDRVGFVRVPGWLTGPMLVAALEDLAPRLQGTIGLLDEAAALALRDRLLESSWVVAARITREFPDRFRVTLDLRRPRLAVVRTRGDSTQVEALVDEAGFCLPPSSSVPLPRTVVRTGPVGTPGTVHPDPRVLAAVAVACEWQREIAPKVAQVPELVEVDASNLGYRFVADPTRGEVRVGLARADGGVAHFEYDHPPGSVAPRVSAKDKAWVLSQVLALRPGLAGVQAGDLRFVNLWRNWLLPRG